MLCAAMPKELGDYIVIPKSTHKCIECSESFFLLLVFTLFSRFMSFNIIFRGVIAIFALLTVKARTTGVGC